MNNNINLQTIPFDNNIPIYLQLVDNLKKQIISGELKPGIRIPSVRDLAIINKVNPNTIQKSLSWLEDEKLIYTERTNGKYVTNDIKLINKYKEDIANEITEKYLKEMHNLNFNNEDITKFINNRKEYK